MSMFVTVGLAHHDAPLAELERIAGTPEDRARLQSDALAAGCAEVMVLSTCSRIELHAVLDVRRDLAGRRASWAAADRLVELLLGPGSTGNADRAAVTTGDLAVHHVFRVAAGLDSRIAGETEVQTQLRLAARRARAQHGEPHRLRGLAMAALSSARASGAAHPELLRPACWSSEWPSRSWRPTRRDSPCTPWSWGREPWGDRSSRPWPGLRHRSPS